ncbi:MAG: cation:proton antiporter, partial [Alphaproteobacteria bacterium]|nr:cation:proton antiporter [Alphaproteobacteria bacterium]
MSDFELRQFLLAVVVLLGAGHFGGYVFQRLGLPRVVGEIAGGLAVGKSVLGTLFPGLFAWLFEDFAGTPVSLAAFYWIGLILLMFTSGFSIEKRIEHSDRRVILTLIAGTTILPFLAGWGLTASVDFSRYTGPAANPLALSLVVAIAVAVTSIPVISRIFIDLGIAEGRFAKIVLSAAIGHDILLWAVLAVATGLVALGQPDIASIAMIVLKTVLFFGAAALVGPWLLYRL